MSRIREAVILALAIVGFGAFLYNAIVDVKDRDRVVNVRGFAERSLVLCFCALSSR